MGGIGNFELLIVLFVVLLLFGGTQLPKLARSLGQAKKEFANALSEDKKSGDKSDEKSGDTSS